jgi:hypothetical protein
MKRTTRRVCFSDSHHSNFPEGFEEEDDDDYEDDTMPVKSPRIPVDLGEGIF